MNVFQLFEHSLAANRERPALVSGVGSARQSASYADMDGRIDAVCRQLGEAGLRTGDRVLLAVPPSIETWVAMLAMLKSGLVIMVIDPAHGARQVSDILREWPPDAVVASRSVLLMRFLIPELRRIRIRFSVTGPSAGARRLSFAGPRGDAFAMRPRSPADSALLTFTSGSTGRPKPVIRTHGFLKRQLEVLRPVAGLEPDDIDFVAMPMFVLFNLANGITSVLPACDMKNPGRADPRAVRRQLEAENVTRIVAAPALLERLAGYCARENLTLPRIRLACTGGGPVSPTLPGRFTAIAPSATVRMVYGSTEAEPIAAIDHSSVSVTATRKMLGGAGLLAGFPVDGCRVAIIGSHPGTCIGPMPRSAFERLALPPGTIGEIVVSGSHVLSGYADASRDPTTKIRVDGETWHRTGDAGYFDEAGMLWLVGRSDAVIRDAQGTVYPFQVEYALSGMSGVRRAAFLSRDGRRTLVLETRGRSFSPQGGKVAACIANHGVERIVSVRRIPLDRRHNTKVDYPALRKLLDGRTAGPRLALADAASRAFRRVRGLCRAIVACCQSATSATKVDGCRQKSP